MGRRNVSWLLGELPGLVESGALTPEGAQRLRGHYAGQAADTRGWAINLFAVLGSVLVGGGLILLLAHNWDQLSRPARTVMSLAPMVIGQALAGWRIFAGKKGVAWREGVGAFWSLSIGASIALIGQTYHLPADFESFLLVWALLSLPVIFLLRSTLAALVYLACAISWAGHNLPVDLWAWLLILVAGLHLARLAEHRRLDEPSSGAWETVLAWALAIAATAAATMTLADDRGLLELAWEIVLTGLFVTLFLVGRAEPPGAESRWRTAFRQAGALGAVGFAWILSFDWPWQAADRFELSRLLDGGGARITAVVFVCLLPVAAAVLCWRRFATMDLTERMIAAVLPVVAAAWLAVLLLDIPGPAIALLNLYVLALGLALTLTGVRDRSRVRANWGMAVLSALILARFFDSELTFLVRGLAFIVLGVGFLVLNHYLTRQQRSAA